MKVIEFGNQQLSKLSFGTVQLGLDYGISNSSGKPTQKTADAIVEYLIDEGINCFDTATAYGNSEEVLGEALGDRENVQLVSKVKSDLFLDDVETIVNSSLKHLKTNKLFGLLLHDSELLSHWTHDYDKKISLLKKKGMIEHFGVSIYTAEEFDLAIENPAIQIIQIPFNLFDQRAINNKWFEKATKVNKLIFIRSIFLQGLFFMDPIKLKGNLLDATSYLNKMHTIRKTLALSIAEFTMAYVDSVAPNAIILFGCDTLDQAKENIKSYNNLPTLENELLDTINTNFSNIPEHVLNPGLWSVQ